MDLTAMFDRLFVVVGYCPNCFSNGLESKVYRPKADRGEWIGDKYMTYEGQHFSGTCSVCGWNTKQGEPISVEEIKGMHSKPKTEMPDIPDDLPFQGGEKDGKKEDFK